MKVKHTPGSWRVRWPNNEKRSPSQRAIVVDDPLKPRGYLCIAWVGSTAAYIKQDEEIAARHDANARLIAAAPDLLEACHTLSQIIRDEFSADGESWDKIKRYQDEIYEARATIAKALGESDS